MKRVAGIALVLTLFIGLGQAESAGDGGSVRSFSTGDNSELVKTIPISRKRGAEQRVVMRIPASRFDGIEAGDRLLAGAEVEVTTCLKSLQPGRDDICVGKPYPYDPHVFAKLIVADDPGDTNGQAIGGVHELQCTQHFPSRNHHCVLVLPWRRWSAGDEPCNGCSVNLVMSAWKTRQARQGNQLVIGAFGSHGPIEGDKGRLSAMRFRDGAKPGIKPAVGRRQDVRIPFANEGGKAPTTFVRSVHLHDLHQGDEIYVEGNTKASIAGVPYNVLLSSSIYSTIEGPRVGGNGNAGRYVSPTPEISEQNGFNCTHGASAHRSPCMRPKLGNLRIIKDVHDLYINLLVSGEAMMNDRTEGSWRHGDHGKILDSYLRAHVYRGG